MGLDSVELIVEVEKTFDIEIPDSEAENIGTVGDFYEAVWGKIKDKESTKCSSAMLFYKFRRFLLTKHSFPYKDFKPSMNLNELIPKKIRKEKWKEIQQTFDYKLPDLELPSLFQQFLFYFGAIIIFGTLFLAILAVNFLDASPSLFWFPVLGIILMIALNYILRPFKTDIGDKNIREFIETVLALNYKRIRFSFGANRLEMERVMNNLIHDKTGADYAEIVPHAHIVDDLGID